ncbi:MAG TPA: hypothetical protein VHQ41_00500 [Patescibacteria group bacterium]|jgi:hypothetical protein|nr:hypothetical protein [Patescibacteria group bacterium]
MSPKLLRKISVLAITLITMGVFVHPSPANAGFFDGLLNTFGLGNGSGYGTSTYDPTAAQHQGDLEVAKRVRRVDRDQDFHKNTTIRSGELVEVQITVKNNSSKYAAQTVVRDELGGSVVYVKNSLTVNGAPSAGGLTSGGLQITIPTKSSVTISYRMNVCSASGYALTASAYAGGVGSASDGASISMENQNTNYYYGSYNDTANCLSQYENANSGTGGYNNGSNYGNTGSYTPTTYGNPFGDWTGVNNATSVTYSSAPTTSSNPFGDWTGVNNSSTTTANNPFAGWSGVNNASSTSSANNPFAGWTGVNNSNSNSAASSGAFGDWTGVNNSADTYAQNNPFGDWTGVNNANSGGMTSTTTTTSNDPFGTWTGVNNSDSTNNPFGDWATTNASNNQNTSNGSDPFGVWTGVSNSDQTSNPFGDWTGVQSSDTNYNSSGYSTTSNSVDSTNRPVAYANTAAATPTHFVAPTTGVNPWAPFGFAGLLTLGYMAFRKRKWLFN